MTIKIAGLTVSEFSKQYKIGESTIYAAYKRNGQQAVIDLLTKMKARQIAGMDKKEKENTKQFLADLQNQVKEKKFEKQNRSLKKEVLFYQSLTVILTTALIILSI